MFPILAYIYIHKSRICVLYLQFIFLFISPSHEIQILKIRKINQIMEINQGIKLLLRQRENVNVAWLFRVCLGWRLKALTSRNSWAPSGCSRTGYSFGRGHIWCNYDCIELPSRHLSDYIIVPIEMLKIFQI